ncbi:MAG TPA: hypothetical protein VHI52_08200, partial [Verrucomicrobiae bacterium]|nr:hypothetical protein [Verrucomicrobiae bacterium]
MVLILLLCCRGNQASGDEAAAKQQSLNEWRNLTSASAPPPRVFVRGDQVRFYFSTDAGVEAFSAHWSRIRVPTSGYKADSALLHWDQRLSHVPQRERNWREATVIAGGEWRRLATNLVTELTPKTPGHGAYYQAFLADRLLYRDPVGISRSVPIGEFPAATILDHQYSMEETLEILARLMDQQLGQTHPGDSLFLIMAPNARRFTQPLLLDRRRHRCVILAPAALYDWVERGSSLAVTAQGLSALLPESHGWALLKNPLSSAARLADLGVETLVRFIRFPLPRARSVVPPLSDSSGMDLSDWEKWLDRYTGTRQQQGSLRLLIDGERFFPTLHEAIV